MISSSSSCEVRVW